MQFLSSTSLVVGQRRFSIPYLSSPSLFFLIVLTARQRRTCFNPPDFYSYSFFPSTDTEFSLNISPSFPSFRSRRRVLSATFEAKKFRASIVLDSSLLSREGKGSVRSPWVRTRSSRGIPASSRVLPLSSLNSSW